MPDNLKKYRQMRDFSDTPEPAGGKPRQGALPTFVIQKHRASHLHYDFRLEMEGVLKSWAIPKGPAYDPAVKRLAMMTEDHPYDYGSFEGQIPEGNYGAGNVIIWDNGQWEFLEPGDDPVAALKSGKLTFRLFGKKMFGEWALVRIGGRSKADKGNEWLLLKHRDEFANEDVDVTKVAPRSVVSNLLVEQIGDDNVWQSNRKAASKKVLTLADALPAKARAKSSARRAVESSSKQSSSRRVVKSSSGPSTTRKQRASKPLDDSKTRRLADSSAPRKSSGLKKAVPKKKEPAAKKQVSSKKKTRAAKKASPRAASSRTRSSRAGSKRSAQPTPRRRPR